MGADRWDEQVGSVADEAAKLLESLRRSAETASGAAPAGPAGAGEPAGAEAHEPKGRHEGEGEGRRDGERPASEAGGHDPFCTWCPLCHTAEVVRSLSPETIIRLADLATLAATVLADFASARAADAPPNAPSDAGKSPSRRPAASAAPRPSPSRPIPVRDAEPVSADGQGKDPKDTPSG